MDMARCIINAYRRALSILVALVYSFHKMVIIFSAMPNESSAVSESGFKEDRANTAKTIVTYREIVSMSVPKRPEKRGVKIMTMVLRPVLSSSVLLNNSLTHSHKPVETTSGSDAK